MAPGENMSLIEGKDHIINNLFGQQKEAAMKGKKQKMENVKLI